VSQPLPTHVSAASDEQKSRLAPLPPSSKERQAGLPPGLAQIAAVLRGIWGLITLNGKVTAGVIIVGFFVLVAIFEPLFIHQNPFSYTTCYTLPCSKPPSAAHWLGTNQANQDVFVQLVVGTRTTIFWTFATGLAVLVISVTIGLVSGYVGGIVDDILSLLTNVFLVVPSLPLAILAGEYFNRSELTIAIIVALTNWAWGARVLRAQTFSTRSREYITAARSTGERAWRIIFFEIFPNQISIVAASFVTTTIQVLLAISGLEFLGLGDSLTISWGNMLNGAYHNSALLNGAWWWFAPPGICIALLGAGLALLNFGIDELADPRLRRGPRIKAPKQQQAAA